MQKVFTLSDLHCCAPGRFRSVLSFSLLQTTNIDNVARSVARIEKVGSPVPSSHFLMSRTGLRIRVRVSRHFNLHTGVKPQSQEAQVGGNFPRKFQCGARRM